MTMNKIDDITLTLLNEADFYHRYLIELYQSAEKNFKRNEYDPQTFINRTAAAIAMYLSLR